MQWIFALWTVWPRPEELRPHFGLFGRTAATNVYSTGANFLILQLCNIAFFQVDAFLIARFLTVDQVTPYSVAQKIFIQTSGLFGIVAGSLWPAYGNAIAQGDKPWIRRVHRKLVGTFLAVYIVLGLGMTLFGHRIFVLWVGQTCRSATTLIAAVALCFLVRDWTGIHSALEWVECGQASGLECDLYTV